MPITALSKITPSLAGANSAGSAANVDGHTIANARGNTLIEVTNGGGGSINVTIVAPAGAIRPADGAFPQMALASNVVAVGAGATRLIGPIPTGFNNSGGECTVTFSGVTTVTVKAIDLPT